MALSDLAGMKARIAKGDGHGCVYRWDEEEIEQILQQHIVENTGELSNTSYRWWQEEKELELPVIPTIRKRYDGRRMSDILKQIEEEMD